MLGRKTCSDGCHRFEPRFNEVPNKDVKVSKSGPWSPNEIRPLLYYKVYVYDICTRCGKVIKAQS